MSIEINLLPWREAQREKRHRRFLVGVGLAALMGIAGGWGLTQFYQQALDVQRERNQFIEAQMQILDKDIEEIRKYQELRERMLTQIKLIRELQFSRPQTVRVFNQLVYSLGEGVHYTELTRQQNQLRFIGRADTNRQVSDQLRAIEATEVFEVPLLSEVQAEESGTTRRFGMSVMEILPGSVAGQASQTKKESTP
ncbi:type IV pilus assembly protein PilN [Modicisalibacter ilicicola DSM 19980]|uniref:Type IV pilus assembly protein PilN n=1 Tax=Modicisalibacter ilicicola DSM 19980 TaxID=1121942 RepID=A0A1M4V1H1_9GAMM|nr:PilN domain-containing protein [Halomonas ilicicola]SHE62841.1 type IV pilus assembly protein PilN [Halomonas ilicicola DSM 19980]